MEIGRKTLREAVNQIDGLLSDYSNDINRAFLKADDALPVSLKVIFAPGGTGTCVESEISFTMEKVKGKSYKRTVDEAQYEIDFENLDDFTLTRQHVMWMIHGDWYNDTFKAFLKRGRYR